VTQMVFAEAEVKEFAEKVEKLCRFLAAKAKHSVDRDALHRMAEDAANMQFANIEPADIVIDGIAEVLR